MGVALLDSSVVVGFLFSDDVLHPAADAALRAAATQHALIVSTVTLAELLTGAKIGHHDEPTVRAFFEQVISERVAVDEPVAERAAELRAARRSLRLPDALILATGTLRADVVLTGDSDLVGVPDAGCEIRYVGDA
ncbi:MAG: PIN domain-containing protein [Solirubrobacteraceae bacterium]